MQLGLFFYLKFDILVLGRQNMNKIVSDDYEKLGFRNSSMKEFVFVFLFFIDDSQIGFIGRDGNHMFCLGL